MHRFRVCSMLTLLFAIAIIPFGLDAQKREFPQPKLPADPKIAAALKEISPQQIQGTIEKLVSFGTRLTLSAQDPGSIAAGHGIGAAREWIKSEFDRYSHDCGGCLEVRTDTFTQPAADRIPKPTEITNVYAVLRGADPENSKRVVLVTGHYDSRNSDTLDVNGDAPGANDDASGTAVSLECARILSKMKFPATIIFLTVAGEEQGLNGGHQTSFNQYGFAAVRFTEFREDYHHQHQNVRTENGIEYGDLTKFVNFDYVASVARLNAATLASLASAPAPPQNVHLLTKELENDSTLTWDKSPRASGYEVLWRSTSSPDWEHAKDVGNVTRATLPISKDNVIFALGAVDGEGHRSLPVTPMPER